MDKTPIEELSTAQDIKNAATNEIFWFTMENKAIELKDPTNLFSRQIITVPNDKKKYSKAACKLLIQCKRFASSGKLDISKEYLKRIRELLNEKT